MLKTVLFFVHCTSPNRDLSTTEVSREIQGHRFIIAVGRGRPLI